MRAGRIFLNESAERGARFRRGPGMDTSRPITATVTLESGERLEGQLVRIDDFLVTVALSDGTSRTFRRQGDVPHVEVRDPKQALEHAHKAIEMKRSEPNFWNTLGTARYRASDWEGAITALNRTAELRRGADSWDAFVLALCRPATAGEKTSLTAFLERETRALQKEGVAEPVARQRALEQVCRVIFNLNEFVYAD